LVGALSPDGGLGLMVYGRLGRTGVYDMQDLLRLVAGEGDPLARVARARKLLADMPATNWLARNPNVADHLEGGDAGLFDLLLHPRDRAFSVEELDRLLTDAELRLLTFIEPARYDPSTYVRDPAIRRRLAELEPIARASFAEQFVGAMARHVVYAVRCGNAVRPAALDSDDAVPMLRNIAGASLANALGTKGTMTIGDGALKLRAPMPRLAGAIAARLDNRISLGELRADLRRSGGQSEADLDAQLEAFYRPLNAFNLLLIRYRNS
jgi:hypothetical protein